MTTDREAAAASEPLPCPFCGLPGYLEAQFGREWWVQCDIGHSTGIMHPDAASALDEWNRRAALSSAPAPDRALLVRDIKDAINELAEGRSFPDLERKAILDMLDEYIPESGKAWDVINEIRALIEKRGEHDKQG